MTQIESAALAWISFAIAGNAILAIALSSTDSAIPTARFRIAQYLSGSGRPSSAVFIMRLTYAAAPARARPGNAATASVHIESRPAEPASSPDPPRWARHRLPRCVGGPARGGWVRRGQLRP